MCSEAPLHGGYTTRGVYKVGDPSSALAPRNSPVLAGFPDFWVTLHTYRIHRMLYVEVVIGVAVGYSNLRNDCHFYISFSCVCLRSAIKSAPDGPQSSHKGKNEVCSYELVCKLVTIFTNLLQLGFVHEC